MSDFQNMIEKSKGTLSKGMWSDSCLKKPTVPAKGWLNYKGPEWRYRERSDVEGKSQGMGKSWIEGRQEE